MTESTPPPVLLDVADGVATVRLNRPDAMNSLDVTTKELLRDTLQQVAADDAVRCVVLTGSGRALEGESDELFATVPAHYNPIVTALVTMPKPVVAAVNGVAAGAGCSLAFACDFRLLADSAGFNLAFTNIALSCDTGSSWTLPRLVGRAKALELLYFPRTIPAAEALELGLATKVVPADELAGEVAELATKLAEGPTVAYGAVRRAVTYSAEHDFADSVAFEGEMMALTGRTRDHRHAVEAFVAKQKPTFEGR